MSNTKKNTKSVKNTKNTKKKKNETSKSAGLIIAIVMVIALIGGGTYAYWVWNSNNIVSFDVNVTLGDFGLTLVGGGGSQHNKMAPAACTHSDYANKKTVTITHYNETNFPAQVELSLNLTSFTWNHGVKPTSDQLSHIHYALVSEEDEGNCSGGVISDSTCSGTMVENIYNTVGDIGIANVLGGDFGNITTSATLGTAQTQNTELFSFTYQLPVGEGTKASPVSETYYLYYWLDEDYEFVNYGSNGIQDPLQDIDFTLSWSASDIEQVEEPLTDSDRPECNS